MSTGGCAKSSTPAWCRRTRPAIRGRADRCALCHREPAASALALCRARHRLRRAARKEDRRRLCHALPEGALDRQGNRQEPYPKIDAKFLGEAKYSDASVMHPAAARQRARRELRHRPPRGLFPAGRLRRAGAHGADLADAASAQEQIAAQIRRRLRQARPSGLCAADRHRRAVATTRTASPAIPPRANMPPTSSTSSTAPMTAGHRLRCVYCEADIDEDVTARFVTADTMRKTFSPGFRALMRAAAEKLRHLHHLSERGRRRCRRLCAARNQSPARPARDNFVQYRHPETENGRAPCRQPSIGRRFPLISQRSSSAICAAPFRSASS